MLKLVLYIFRATTGLLVFIGERPTPGINVGSDFVLLGLLNGRLYVEFNNNGGLHSLSATATSEQLYNDTQIHHVNFTFETGMFRLSVDSVEISLESKST